MSKQQKKTIKGTLLLVANFYSERVVMIFLPKGKKRERVISQQH